MKKLYSVVLALFTISFLHSQDKIQPFEHFAHERTYHVVHYKIDITLDEKAKTCDGEVDIKLVPLRPQLDVVRLDAAEMTIRGVKFKDQSLIYHVAGESLFVDLGKPYTSRDTINLQISYLVSSPKKGLYFIRPDSGYPNKQWQVWSNGETEDNHFWFPCYDFPNEKSTSEMVVTVNEKWTAISNGKLLDVKHNPKNHTATYHWYEGKPHVSYLISLCAGEYVELKDSWGKVPLSYFVYKQQQNNAPLSFSKSTKIMDFFSTKIGYPYPWEKYSQTVVQDYILGGEENVSATTLTDLTIHDARAHLDYSSDGLVAHEMSHQWWGDLLTCRDWSQAWLNEGFASYFDILFQEYDKGEDVALKSIYDAQRNVAASDVGDRRRPTVTNKFVNGGDVFDNRIYGKGACVLHMMRYVLGDELFWKVINAYVHKYEFQNVETNDLKVVIEDVAGYNLHWFFDEWLYKAGSPEFNVHSSFDDKNKMVNVTVRQTQKTDSLTGIFTTPLDIEVWVHDVPQTYRVTVKDSVEVFSFPAYQQPQLVIFDKGSRILKKIKEDKSLDEWVFQLKHAQYGVDRIAAVDELRWMVDSAKANEAICAAALNDPFVDVRREAVLALGDARKTDVSKTLLAAYGDREARVRSACMLAMKNTKHGDIMPTLLHAFEQDSSYSVVANALSALVVVDSANGIKYCNEGLQRDSYRESIRMSALRALATIASDSAFYAIKKYTAYGYDRNVRIEGLWQLGRTWKTRDETFQYVMSMLNDPSFNVKRAAIQILGTMGNAKAMSALQNIADHESETRLVKEARDAMAKLQEPKTDTKK